MKLDTTSTRNRRILNFRKFGFKDLQVLGKYNYNKAEGKLQSHVHKGMIEICYYDKGSQYFEVNGEQYLVKGGDVFIHYPGEVHGSGGHPEEKGALYWLIIKLSSTTTDRLSLLCKYLIEKNKRHFKAGKAIKKGLEDIFLAAQKKEAGPIKKARLHLMVETFILRLLDDMQNDKTETANVRLNKVLSFIEENITRQIALSVLAKEANLSESRFKNFFKESTGFTPGDYIQRRKVELALETLRNNPDISLTQLAYELDFSSPQYFSTVVKKHTGNPPKAFRQS